MHIEICTFTKKYRILKMAKYSYFIFKEILCKLMTFDNRIHYLFPEVYIL